MAKVAPAKKHSIVIIDKDETYLKIWEKICANFTDSECFCFRNAKSAKKLIKSHKVDLVICEIVLPKSDGYEIAKMTHKYHPKAEIVLTTAYDCDLSRFNIKDPHFSILYKPYTNIDDIQAFISHLLHNEDVFSDASEDSFKENEMFPEVMEWKL